MKEDCTHITVILDRTGSMESIRDDTIGGFNTFLKYQKAEPGTASLTLVQFDTQDPYEVIHHFKPIGQVPELNRETYVPRASTPLLDAIGRAINDLEQSLAKLKEEDQPSKVAVVIVTDGKENSGREFRKDQIEKMVKEKTEKSAGNSPNPLSQALSRSSLTMATEPPTARITLERSLCPRSPSLTTLLALVPHWAIAQDSRNCYNLF